MPFIISDTRRGGRVLAIALALAFTAFIATPAHAATIANPYACTPQPTLSSAFAAWSDDGSYTPVQNAGVEDGSTGWTLSGAAAVTRGNEPWKIGGASHANSLSLPAGSSAVAAPICIDETYPYFRLFAERRYRQELPEDRGPVLRHQGQAHQHEALRLHHHLDRLAADRDRQDQRLHTQDDGRCGPGRLPLHPSGSDRPLPDRRRLRRPVVSRLSSPPPPARQQFTVARVEQANGHARFEVRVSPAGEASGDRRSADLEPGVAVGLLHPRDRELLSRGWRRSAQPRDHGST